ncbi:hypothetical protein T08_4602 [Trichinella sp. T8]|nr:hypothetical protein T08_4602 [Trichinella sp. T8]
MSYLLVLFTFYLLLHWNITDKVQTIYTLCLCFQFLLYQNIGAYLYIHKMNYKLCFSFKI